MQQPVALADMCQKTKIVVYHNTCPICGRENDDAIEIPESLTEFMPGGNTKNLCDSCYEQKQQFEEFERQKRRREDFLQKADIPEDFLTWDKDKGDNQLARKVLDNADKSLFVCGKNAACKTRATAFNLKLQITKENRRCKFIRWSDLALGYARTCRMSSENSKAYIDEFLSYDVLLIDDIGKRRITETAGEMLYDMIDLVYSGAKKTKLWITSNKTLADFADTFENIDLGDAVVSRLDRLMESDRMIKLEVGA